MNQLMCYCQGSRIAGTLSVALPLLPLMCVPVHPILDIQMCGTHSILIYQAEESCVMNVLLVARLKGRDKGNVLGHHDADVSSYFIS